MEPTLRVPTATDGQSVSIIALVADAVIGRPDGQFLDVRGGGEAGQHVSALNRLGWSGTSVEDATAVESGPVSPDPRLVIVADPAELPAVLVALSDRGVEPWLIVIAVGPDQPPVIVETFRSLLFDGTHEYLIASAHAARAGNLSRAAVEASESIRRWRASALEGWDERARRSNVIGVHQEMEAMRQTLSWRVTRPLRAVRVRMPARPTQ